MNDSNFIHFVEYELQAIALAWMAILYSIKIFQLSRLPMPWEQGDKKGSPNKGVLRSYASIFLPWSMESSRKNIWRWIEFSLYHIGAFVAILNTFTYTFAPVFMTSFVRRLFAVLIAFAFVVGFIKLIRRLFTKALRFISIPDDYFSIISLQLFFFSAIMVLLNESLFWRPFYFIVTALFLFYVPFSKISHYIYFFFARYLTGKRYGWRGVIPQNGGKK